jgi:hypothetical protein
MDDKELRYQLLDSINGPLEDAMYDAFGSKIYTIPDNIMLEELEKFAVKEIIKYVNYSTKVSEENPVKQQPAHSSPAHSSPAKQPSTKFKPQPMHKHWLRWGFPEKIHMDLLPGGMPRRSTSTQYRQEDQHQDLASKDQHKSWHQKPSTSWQKKSLWTAPPL